MFFTLLIITFLIALAVSYGVVRLFDRPIGSILRRIVAEELSGAWCRYIKFAAYVVGISGGVRIHELERYISAPHKDEEVLILNSERWTLEVYRTVIETLQGIAWMFWWFSWWRWWRMCSPAASSCVTAGAPAKRIADLAARDKVGRHSTGEDIPSDRFALRCESVGIRSVCLPIRALSAGCLAGLGARPTLSTDC